MVAANGAGLVLWMGCDIRGVQRCCDMSLPGAANVEEMQLEACF